MKKINLLLVMLLSMATSLMGKCDWSKVSLGKSNTCNAYKFEVSGTVDTCYKHSIMIVKKGSTTALYKGDSRVFSYTFNDTGYYYVRVAIKNACCGGDTVMYNLIHVECKPITSKCNWSSIKLQQWNERNYYKWYLSGSVLDDTCVNFMFTVIDVQTKKLDTLYQEGGFCEVQFNKKGKYYLRVVLRNKCKGCDTLIYRPIELIYFPNCKFSYNMKSTNGKCLDSIVGEMSLGPWIKGDTCWEWYSYMWNGPLLDSLSQHDWDSMSEDQLWNYYDFNDSDLVHYDGPTNSARIIKYKFPHEGHYLIATQWYNKCLDQDTFFFTRITIENCATNKTKLIIPLSNGIKVSPNPADDKVIFTTSSTNKIASNTYEIYDSKGKLMLTGSMGGSVCVGVTNLPNGVYVVRIGKLSQKFLIQH